LGFKKGAYLENTVGDIDADYQFAKNYGHIMIKMGGRLDPVHLVPGEAFCQGIITKFLKTDDDNPVSWDRDGGFGSTTEKTKGV
jgi:dUTP pyrophosphatase